VYCHCHSDEWFLVAKRPFNRCLYTQ